MHSTAPVYGDQVPAAQFKQVSVEDAPDTEDQVPSLQNAQESVCKPSTVDQEPGLHLVQLEAPRSEDQVPAGQLMHESTDDAPLMEDHVPSLHETQELVVDATTEDHEPAVQLIQLIDPPEAHEPTGQVWQTVLKDAPTTVDQVPSLQGIHEFDDEATTDDHAPASQLRHDSAPVTDDHEPVAHCWQAVMDIAPITEDPVPTSH